LEVPKVAARRRASEERVVRTPGEVSESSREVRPKGSPTTV